MENYIAKLNEYVQKTRGKFKFEDVGCDGPDHMKTFSIRVVLNDQACPVGVGNNKKQARQKAAELALRALKGRPDSGTTENTTPAPSTPSQSPFRPSNYVCWLNEYGHQQRVNIRPVESPGPGLNSPLRCCRFVVGDKEYPKAMGNTKKEAKEEAARLVYNEICGGEEGTTSSEGTEEFSMSLDKNSSGFSSDESASIKEPDMNKNMGKSETSSRFIKEFEVIECLGRGTFGEVYKVKHKELQKHYAVKVVCRERHALREVDVLSDLLHNNIIRYYSFWDEDNNVELPMDDSTSSSASSSQSTGSSSSCFLYIQMELCDNKTLKRWIMDTNSESPKVSNRRREGLKIALQITSGVEYFHNKSCIHRDLKPENILFGLDGTVKIGDFGLVTRDINDGNRTADVGTPSYMAPEQKNKKYDRKVDIFSMGLIFLELWWKISSGHERAKIFQEARCQKLPNQFKRDFFEENQLIVSMLREIPSGRLEASEVKKKLQSLEKGRSGAHAQSQSM